MTLCKAPRIVTTWANHQRIVCVFRFANLHEMNSLHVRYDALFKFPEWLLQAQTISALSVFSDLWTLMKRIQHMFIMILCKAPRMTAPRPNHQCIVCVFRFANLHEMNSTHVHYDALFKFPEWLLQALTISALCVFSDFQTDVKWIQHMFIMMLCKAPRMIVPRPNPQCIVCVFRFSDLQDSDWTLWCITVQLHHQAWAGSERWEKSTDWLLCL